MHPIRGGGYTCSEEALYCSPIRRGGYTYSEEALYLLLIRRGGYTYSEEALYLLHIRRGGYTYIEEALYLLHIRRGGYTYSGGTVPASYPEVRFLRWPVWRCCLHARPAGPCWLFPHPPSGDRDTEWPSVIDPMRKLNIS